MQENDASNTNVKKTVLSSETAVAGTDKNETTFLNINENTKLLVNENKGIEKRSRKLEDSEIISP